MANKTAVCFVPHRQRHRTYKAELDALVRSAALGASATDNENACVSRVPSWTDGEEHADRLDAQWL